MPPPSTIDSESVSGSSSGFSHQPPSSTSSTTPSTFIRGPWADEPWPLFETPGKTHNANHPAIHIADETAHTYNAIFRGINSIFHQAPFVTAARDVSDFLFFVCSLGRWIAQHHHSLYSRAYPKYEAIFERPGVLTSTSSSPSPPPSRPKEEDLSFLPVLDALIRYAEETRARPQTYDAGVLLQILEDLAPGLHAHAFAQIVKAIGMVSLCETKVEVKGKESGATATATAAAAATAVADRRAVALLNAWRALDAEDATVTATANHHSVDRARVLMPMLVRLRDTTFEGGNDWPRLPVLAVHAIADRLSPAHAGAWRFLPCTVWGRPRELPFLTRQEKGGVVGVGGS